MISYPKAKVNIGLQITEKRSDGFHNLETLFFPAPVSDILEIVESGALSMNLYGMELDCDPNKNLCVKAYELLKRDFAIPPVEIHLYKKIPFGAGLGGGSSDAASALIMINRLFGLGLSVEGLANYAALLGSDCPYFVLSGNLDPMIPQGYYASGRGEILSKVDIPALKDCVIEVEKPDVSVSTALAYSKIIPAIPQTPLRELIGLPVERWRENIFNDFEPSIFKMFPVIEEYKRKMYERGAIYASMSGSGSAVFGIFKK